MTDICRAAKVAVPAVRWLQMISIALAPKKEKTVSDNTELQVVPHWIGG